MNKKLFFALSFFPSVAVAQDFTLMASNDILAAAAFVLAFGVGVVIGLLT